MNIGYLFFSGYARKLCPETIDASVNTDLVMQIKTFLLGGSELPPTPLLQTYRLGAYAYTRIPASHPARAEFRRDFIIASANHLQVRSELLPLIRAWREAGIDVLVFKGFYLAEFIYPMPSQRFYGDVDILIKPVQSSEARRIAIGLGWVESWNREEAPNPFAHVHEEVHLDRLGKVRLDIHRYVIHCDSPFDSLQKRFTEAAWAASVDQEWEDTSIKVLQPVDTVLIGLALNRAWSDYFWQVKPHDILDFKHVITHSGLTRSALEARAEQLGCSRTLKLFLNLCNPWTSQLELAEPTFRQRQTWNMAVSFERGHLGFERFVRRLLNYPGLFQDSLEQFPILLRVRFGLARKLDLYKLLVWLDTVQLPESKASFVQQERVARGVKWGARLLWPLKRDRCIPIALSLFSAFRAQGVPIRFCIGEQHSRNKLQLHAWVELQGQMESLGDVQVCEVDKVHFCYPPASEVGADPGAQEVE